MGRLAKEQHAVGSKGLSREPAHREQFAWADIRHRAERAMAAELDLRRERAIIHGHEFGGAGRAFHPNEA